MRRFITYKVSVFFCLIEIIDVDDKEIEFPFPLDSDSSSSSVETRFRRVDEETEQILQRIEQEKEEARRKEEEVKRRQEEIRRKQDEEKRKQREENERKKAEQDKIRNQQLRKEQERSLREKAERDRQRQEENERILREKEERMAREREYYHQQQRVMEQRKRELKRMREDLEKESKKQRKQQLVNISEPTPYLEQLHTEPLPLTNPASRFPGDEGITIDNYRLRTRRKEFPIDNPYRAPPPRINREFPRPSLTKSSLPIEQNYRAQGHPTQKTKVTDLVSRYEDRLDRFREELRQREMHRTRRSILGNNKRQLSTREEENENQKRRRETIDLTNQPDDDNQPIDLTNEPDDEPMDVDDEREQWLRLNEEIDQEMANELARIRAYIHRYNRLPDGVSKTRSGNIRFETGRTNQSSQRLKDLLYQLANSRHSSRRIFRRIRNHNL